MAQNELFDTGRKQQQRDFEPMTEGGFPLDEAASALQKCIRRGLEAEAVYWAQELESRFQHYLWKRLVVIAHEDIGIASPEVVTFVKTCREDYYWLIEKGAWENLLVINAVVAMCRAKKTRLSISLCLMTYESDVRMDVPDFALDMHTKRGRAMGRGIEHFQENCIKLHNKDEDCDPYEDFALAEWNEKGAEREWCKKRAGAVRKAKK